MAGLRTMGVYVEGIGAILSSGCGDMVTKMHDRRIVFLQSR